MVFNNPSKRVQLLLQMKITEERLVISFSDVAGTAFFPGFEGRYDKRLVSSVGHSFEAIEAPAYTVIYREARDISTGKGSVHDILLANSLTLYFKC